MPLPASVPTGTVSGTWYTPSGNLAVGKIIFLLTHEIEIPDDADGVVIPVRHEVTVSAGQLTATLPAGYYNVLVRLSELYFEPKVVQVVAGQNLNLPDAIGVVPPEELLTPVRTVNGIGPDASGNIEVSGGGGAVSSVFGRTGAVVAQNGDYTKAQVGLSNVDNTSDANKPISTATQTALDGKYDPGDDILALYGFHSATSNISSFRAEFGQNNEIWIARVCVRAGRAINKIGTMIKTAGVLGVGGVNGFAIASDDGSSLLFSVDTDNIWESSGLVSVNLGGSAIPAQSTDKFYRVQLSVQGYATAPVVLLNQGDHAVLSDYQGRARLANASAGYQGGGGYNPVTFGLSTNGFYPLIMLG
jgi:hypothetical protein